jgi:uncharacterized protein (TIGR02145 family)
MKNMFRISGIILLILSVFLIHSCKKDKTKEETPLKTTITPGTLSDIDGNVYKTITIDDHNHNAVTWMAANLKTTRYSNGDLVGTTNPVTLDIRNMDEPSYQWPVGNDESNVATYGRLYTWYVVSDLNQKRNVCPTGWHVSTRGDWTSLNNIMQVKNVGNDPNSTDNGGRLKEIGTTHWETPNLGATDEIGFSALPAGWRYCNNFSNGDPGTIGDHGYWWVNDSGWCYSIDYSTAELTMMYINSPKSGLSIRCVKN